MSDKTYVTHGEIINKLYDAIRVPVETLYTRWMNEKGYEDFSEYEKILKEKVNQVDGVTFIAAVSKPFGFRFNIGLARYRFTLEARGAFLNFDFKAID